MATYEYVNELGETFEISASMNNPPPEEILRVGPGPDDWQRADEMIEGANEVAFVKATPSKGIIYARSYENSGIIGIGRNRAITKNDRNGLPTSSAACRVPKGSGEVVNRFGHDVREMPDGTHASLDGKPIIGNNTDFDKVKARTGMDED